jgi:hypothetical protein
MALQKTLIAKREYKLRITRKEQKLSFLRNS